MSFPDKNCMSYWFLPIERTGVRVPRTKLLSARRGFAEILDIEESNGAGCPGFRYLIHWIECAARKIGGFPVFLRTGLTSGKHDWKNTCFLQSKDAIPGQVYKIVEYSEMVDIMGLPTDVWAVREMLQPVSAFTAFYGEMPVSLEFRCFVRGDNFLYMIPYWQEESIARVERHYPPSVRDWRNALRSMYQSFREEEYDHLVAETRKVGVALAEEEGDQEISAWSVDWMKCQDGNWYCIDAAQADRSWGWLNLTTEGMDDQKRMESTLDELAKAQGVRPMTDARVLFGTWPGDDDDRFEDMIQEHRQEKA